MAAKPSTSSMHTSEQLKAENEKFRQEIARAMEEDDPLEPYERYVAWLIEKETQNTPGIDLELLVVLEQGVRSLHNDPIFKADLRYLKLWLAYAQRVEKPDIIYVHLLRNEIGVVYAQLYEEYALYLEQQNRIREAEQAYRLGISRKTRAVERLKTRFREFEERVSSKETLKSMRRAPNIPISEVNSPAARLYRNPLRNFSDKSSSASSSKAKATAAATSQASTSVSTLNSDSNQLPSITYAPPPPDTDPYSFMKAALQDPPVPGKRPEKFRFDLSLLFKNDQEYCIQEARAKSLGLLGKKWGPPPASEPGPHQMTIPVTDGSGKQATRTLNGHMRMTTNLTANLANEPTVTINTKEALRDVFGMYNSPEKSVKLGRAVPGSKNAPIKKLDLRPAHQKSTLREITEAKDEGTRMPMKAPFKPFVDVDAKKEAPRFRPFIDENADRNALKSKGGERRVLVAKETFSAPREGKEERKDESEGSKANKAQFSPVFSNIFRAPSEANKSRPPLQSKDAQERPPVFCDPQEKVQRSSQQLDSVFSPQIFSRPSESTQQTVLSEPIFTPKPSEDMAKIESAFHRNVIDAQRAQFAPASRERQTPAFAPQRRPLQSVTPQPVPEPELELGLEPEQEPESEQELGSSESDAGIAEFNFLGQAQEEDGRITDDSDSFVDENASEPDDNYEDELPRTAPLGGRLGYFDVMTPIAERTFECTMSTRNFHSLPKKDAVIFGEGILDGQQTTATFAQRLEDVGVRRNIINTRDLGECIVLEDDEPEDDGDIVERTGTLSLADAIAAAGSFKPANPCNPTDAQIIKTLISLSPLEADLFDHPSVVSSQSENLLKFADKRRSSGKSKLPSSICIRLEDQRFDITELLGRGGFGAVFKAKAIKNQAGNDEDDFSDIDEDDEDDEKSNTFAIKLVKPRNIWEFHILRRVHNNVPTHLKSSIIHPHALYAYRDESFLILDLCNQGTLLDVVNHAADAGILHQGACLDELLVMFFSIELIKFIEVMHGSGFIHSDFKIDNCLLRLDDVPGGTNAWSGLYQPNGDGGWRHKGIKMIDFGRCIDTRMYPAGQKFIADWETDAGDCRAMQEGRPWTYDADYHGLAGIIYCMLFGKHFDDASVVRAPSADADDEAATRYKIAQPFKRYWQTEIWTCLFDLLLNSELARPDGSMPLVPELASIREEMESWLSSNCSRSSNTLKGLLKKIERSVLSRK